MTYIKEHKNPKKRPIYENTVILKSGEIAIANPIDPVIIENRSN